VEPVMMGSAAEDAWQKKATDAAIAAARKVVLGDDAAINKNAQIGRLSDTEWGWIVTAVLFAWIGARAEQAATEELDTEQTIRLTGLDPNPWDAGAIAAILPELAQCRGIDWSKPLNDWSRETMIEFLLVALRLVRRGMLARDRGGGITRKSMATPPADTAAGELDDALPL
jgi:hypothetical protein